MCVWEQNKKVWSVFQCVLILIDIWIGGSVHQLFVNRLDVSQKFRRDFRPSWRHWWWDLWWSWFYHETFLWHSEAWSLCLTVIPCDCSREQFSKSEVFVCARRNRRRKKTFLTLRGNGNYTFTCPVNTGKNSCEVDLSPFSAVAVTYKIMHTNYIFRAKAKCLSPFILFVTMKYDIFKFAKPGSKQ